ncbi:hypothetical protein WSM22_32200 [Cytophagales bacterium WSM2-2]|nr:hypothetical protein WSM22_32200 [Cytophagales bacterium WSM2-2]
MKKPWLIALVALVACQKSETVSDFTGNEASYGLIQASSYTVNGTVRFKERKDGGTTVQLQLKGTSGTAQLPVHLHLGDVADNGTDIVALLNSVDAKTGISETVISELADDSKVSYKDLLKLSAYVNVHASSSGPQSNVILVAGNIGSNGTKLSSNSRIGVCSSKTP